MTSRKPPEHTPGGPDPCEAPEPSQEASPPPALAALRDTRSDPTPSCHGTVVSARGRGLLITGPSGSGKSALALQLIALGARLVADDRVLISARGTRLLARAPDATTGLIEARGLGLIAMPAQPEAPLAAVLDLGACEDARLPRWRHIVLLRRRIPLIYAPPGDHAASALLLYLTHGRHA